jgi:soluble lytic murein transglycosylase-like protein
MMTAAEVRKLIEKVAKDLNVDLLLAIVKTESSFDPWDVRYEPDFNYLNQPAYFALKHQISVDTEKMLQKTSWGLFQLMGGSARDLGFTDNLTKLTIPEVSVVWGAEYFRKRCARYPKLEDQIAAYNAGSVVKDISGNYSEKVQKYVEKVMKNYQDLS